MRSILTEIPNKKSYSANAVSSTPAGKCRWAGIVLALVFLTLLLSQCLSSLGPTLSKTEVLSLERSELQRLDLCLERPPADFWWYQFAVYDRRPLPERSGGFPWIARTLNDGSFDFGDASLLADPLYSGAGPLLDDATMRLRIPRNGYLYILLGRENEEPIFWNFPEAELALLLSMHSNKPSAQTSVYPEAEQIVYEAGLNPQYYDNVRISVVPRGERESDYELARKEKEKQSSFWERWFGLPAPLPAGHSAISWTPGGCPADNKDVMDDWN